MQSSNNKNDESQIIKCYRRQNKSQYICFHPTVPTSILELIQQPNQDLMYKWIKIIYNEIAGKQTGYNIYLCQNQQKLIQILKHVSSFGGSHFNGKRYHKTLQGNQIRLKFSHIQHITFKNIKKLNFSHCYLYSIQILAMLDIESVKEIQLSWNIIVSLKSFRKISFNHLTNLVLSRNLFNYHSYENLSRLHCSQLAILQIQDSSMRKYDPQDLRLLSKLQIDQNRWNKKQKLKVKCQQTYSTLLSINWKNKVNNHSLIILEER